MARAGRPRVCFCAAWDRLWLPAHRTTMDGADPRAAAVHATLSALGERAWLRKALRPLARLHATRHGFKLEPLTGDVAVLARPVEEKHAPILAFLSDGEAWSSSALALALGTSQRTVQRALDALANAGKVEAIGQGRARRWVASPVLGFTTTLLLTAPLPGG